MKAVKPRPKSIYCGQTKHRNGCTKVVFDIFKVKFEPVLEIVLIFFC